jgi:hypothetical protein
MRASGANRREQLSLCHRHANGRADGELHMGSIAGITYQNIGCRRAIARLASPIFPRGAGKEIRAWVSLTYAAPLSS